MHDINQGPSDAPSFQHRLEELQERASKDALSGLLNRGTSEQYINRRLQSMAADDVCALFIIDLDNFKQINDTLGHQAGDQAIRQSARILSSLFRATDIVGRLGGDEFIVFLSGPMKKAAVHRKGQEICQQLQLVLGSAPSITMTASVGIYMVTGGAQSFDDLYQSADLALYKAKKNGKHGFFIKYSDGLSESEEENFLPVNTIPLGGLLEYMDSGVALLEMGSPYRLIYVSPSFCRLIGADAHTYALPHPLCDMVHPDDLADLEQALQTGLSQNSCVDHTHRVSADGKVWRWWHIRAVQIEYSNPHPVMLVTATDVSRFKENESQLREVNERLQSAFEQTTQSMWEVDTESHIFTLFYYSRSAETAAPPQGPFPDFLISNGWIHPTSVERFRVFAQELLNGRMQGYGNFIIQYQNTGCYGWATMSYRRLCDDVGGTAKAVGIIEKLPLDFGGQENHPISKHSLPGALTPYLTTALYADLTQDSIRGLWIEGKNLSRSSGISSCTQVLAQGMAKIFSADERQSLSGYFDRERLLISFAQRDRWTCLSYRRVDGSGAIRWVDQVIQLAEDPLTKDITLFAYLIQTDIRHRREQELGIDVVRDPITKLYDRATTRAMVEFQIRRGRANPCALAIIQLDGLDQLDADSEQAMRRNYSHVAQAMAVALGPQCIVGQYSRSSLLAFWGDVSSPEDVKHALEEAFSFVRFSLANGLPMDSLRFVAGVTCTGADCIKYTAMTAQCIQLCQMWCNAASDMVVFSQEDGDETWDELQRSARDDQITVRSSETEHRLSEEEKDVTLQCMSAMLSARSLDASIRNVLHTIGTYYQADRVYVLALMENGHVITMPYEWTSPRKPSIQEAVSGMLVERFPILKRCLKEQAPVLLARREPISPDHQATAENLWRFAAFPLSEDNRTHGFLCVENAQEHASEVTLATTMVPYILGEWKRFHTQMEMPGDLSGAFLQGLPNLRAYMNVIYTLNSDFYSSLGAVCLDVPGLSSINGSLGFEYGSKLLLYVSKTLADIFGNTFLFRTWDAEFVVLCPDTTRQVFVGRCTRLRSILQRRYPKDIRIGYTWSNGVFSGRNLVSEARAIMRCEQVPALPKVRTLTMDDGLHSAEEGVRLGRFTVYFQPRVHMTTGALVGAEALVRGVDKNGGLVPPDRFVPELENSGDIRDLDLYVLDRALAQMDRWRQRGWNLFPVSVNFSRFTLFDPAAPASVLAIQSRYPLLPPELLEIEITESAGSMDSQTLSEVMDRFRQFGIQFALDDFGSRYANISIFTHVKFDFVKLDRSLISDLATNARSQMLVRNLVEICHTSGMLCVAEGVETQAQIDALSKAGCVYGQGYYFDRPLSADGFEKKYLHPAPAESNKLF